MASKILILYDDLSETASFSGPAWDPPIENIIDPRPSKVARSVDASSANTKFFFEFDSEISIPALIIAGTNLDEDAQYRITAYSDAGFSISIFTTALQDFWTSPNAIFDPDFKGIPLIAQFGQTVTARYWQVELFNATNPATYIELGKLFLGKALNQTYNMLVNSTFSRDSNTAIQKAIGGTPYFSRHRNIRSWKISFPPEEYDVAWDEIDKFGELSGQDRQLFVIGFPDDTDRRHQHSFLCTLQKPSDLTFLEVDRASTAFELVEYVG